MPSYFDLSRAEIEIERDNLLREYSQFREKGLRLSMTRGKPGPEQLDLANRLLTCLDERDYLAADGTDCRNYGGLEGLPEARKLFADILEITTDEVMVLGNSSLNIMYDILIKAMLFPLPGATLPWTATQPRRFICPVPGYDRHFAITEQLGFSMIPVRMTDTGPDMDQVEALVASDPAIKGMWAVPVYNNPDGTTYSEKTCSRLASMPTAAADFRIFCDNAYAAHHLDFTRPQSIPDIIGLCREAGNENRVFLFTSTSKITWAGAGIACVASSQENLQYLKDKISYQTIGPDKINQLRHVRFLKDRAGVERLMQKQAGILKPKFDLVNDILESELGDKGICSWKEPAGGYFFSINVLPGTAKKVVSLAGDCGVELTPAGSTWPCRIDPSDQNIRLAPSFPPLDELRLAMHILCVCVRLAALEILSAGKSSEV